MKILWICNVIIEPIANDMGVNSPISGGWIMGLFNEIIKHPQYELAICFPYKSKDIVSGTCNNVKYYSFYQRQKFFGLMPDTLSKNSLTKKHLEHIMRDVKPDILYVFGTEYSHSLLAIEAFGKPERTIVNIQGMTSAYYRFYYADLPRKVIYKFALSNIIRGSIRRQYQNMKKRGQNEQLAILKSGHAVGRTDWDRAHLLHINPHINYHCCRESLRSVFYNPPRLWDFKNCKAHSIFMSQGSYPLKGLHYLLWALPLIKRVYPDVHVYIGGPDPIKKRGPLKERLSVSSYGLYLRGLLSKNDLEGNVTFLGKLTQEQMVDAYLESNVYLLASSIENSPNSLGEAMLLGVPCVASDVGGVKTMLTHEQEGLLYQHNEIDMLADCIIRIFDMEDNVSIIAKAGREHALKTHDRVINCESVIQLYEEIAG